MKKTISLILALVLCLCLCACSIEAEVPVEEIADWIPHLCGEWKVLHQKNVDKLAPVSISEDGTLSVGDQSFTWKAASYSDSDLQLNLYNGWIKVGHFSLKLQSNDLIASITLDELDDISLYKPTHYETITITPENIDEYFEMQYVPEFDVDKNGEVTRVYIEVRFALKDEFYDRLSDHVMLNYSWGAGTLECNYETGTLDVAVDLTERTISILGFNSQEVGGGTCNFEFGDFFGIYLGFADLVPGFTLNNGMGHGSDIIQCLEPTSGNLTIYLIAE